MKAWHFTEYNAPLSKVELPDPVPASGEVLIDIKASGLCHSDVAIMQGVLPELPHTNPVVLGHEIAGVISALADDVTDYAVGDRVGVYQMAYWHGDRRDGGYAEKVTAPTDSLVRVPDGTTFEQAAISTDAGMTSYHAVVTTGGVGKGTKLGIIGLGGLGTIDAQVGKGLEATVYGAEPSEAARERASELGLAGIVEDVLEFEGLDLDVIVDFAGFGTTTAGALEVIRPGGTVVQVGLGVSEANINTMTLVSKQVRLLGSYGGDESDIAAVYDLFDSGAITSSIETISIDDVQEGIERLEAGTAKGRLVMVND